MASVDQLCKARRPGNSKSCLKEAKSQRGMNLVLHVTDEVQRSGDAEGRKGTKLSPALHLHSRHRFSWKCHQQEFV